MKSQSLKKRMLTITLISCFVPLIISSILMYNLIQKSLQNTIFATLEELATSQLSNTEVTYNSSLKTLAKSIDLVTLLLSHYGAFGIENSTNQVNGINQITKESTTFNIKNIRLGSTSMYNNTEIIDEVSKQSGTLFTIFQYTPQGMLRIATNVKKADGSRATGTYIPTSSPVYQAISNDQEYTGQAVVVDKPCLVVYRPIKVNGQVVGALFVGFHLETLYDNEVKTIRENPILEKGYYFVFNTKGDNAGKILFHNSKEGESILNEKFTQEMIEKKQGKITFKSPFTKETMWAHYCYFEPLDWMIVSSCSSKEISKELIAARLMTVGIMLLFFFLIYITLPRYLNNEFITPIFEIVKAIDSFSNKEFTFKFGKKFSQREDEIGQIVHSYENAQSELTEAFNMIKNDSNILLSKSDELANTSTSLKNSSSQVTEMTNGAKHATIEIVGNINTIASATEQAATNVKHLAESSDRMSTNANMVASATEETSSSINLIADDINGVTKQIEVISQNVTNVVQLVNNTASAIEEMSASLSEVAHNSQEANLISQQADEHAVQTKEIILSMRTSANEIGSIIKVISDIADQTNMLALNATIEAASAGEAGKGFAVVANEVKELAKQTAEATNRISHQIENMQKISENAAISIESIAKIIYNLHSINNTIASSVEEQSITTNEIAQSMQKTAISVSGVGDAVLNIENSANQVSNQLNEATKGIMEIASSSADSAELANALATNSDEVSHGVVEISSHSQSIALNANQISVDIDTILSASQETFVSSEYLQESSKELNSLAMRLQDMINRFKV